MAITAAAGLFDVLRTFQLLRAAQLEEIQRELLPRADEAAVLGDYLVKLGWLTPFQIELLLEERIQELVLGHFLLLDRLADGSSGQMYKARHLRMNRIVALRIIRKDLLADPVAVERFYAEVQAASLLTHDNLVLAYDAGPIGETHFLTTQYVSGRDLAGLVENEGPLPLGRACTYVYQTALGLQHALERGLQHGNLSPGKLIVSRSLGSDSWNARTRQQLQEPEARQKPGVVKIVGMGLSRLVRDGSTPQRRAYLAPEQLQDGAPLDVRTDIYVLGSIFHYLLTGKHPDAERLAPVPVEVEGILERMRGTQPTDRYQAPVEVAQALASLIEVGTEVSATETQLELDAIEAVTAAASEPPTVPLPRPQQRWPLYVCTAAVLVASGVLGVGFYLRPGDEPPATVKRVEPGETPVQAALRELQARAKNPKEKPAELWQDLARFAMQHAGTPEANSATHWLGRLSSPLDRLDGRNVPADERFALPDAIIENLVGVEGQRRWRSFFPHTRYLTFKADGKLLAAATGTDIILWDPATGWPARLLRAHQGLVAELAFNAEGNALYSVGQDRHLRIWDVEAGRQAAAHDFGQELDTVALARDRSVLAAAGSGGFIQLWSPTENKELGRLTGHKGRVVQLSFSPDGKLLASAGQEDGTVRLWDVAEKKELRQLPGHAGGAIAVAFSPKGDLVASGGVDQHLRWSTIDGTEVKRVRPSNGPVSGVRFAPDGLTIASASQDGVAKLWETATGNEIAAIAEPDRQAFGDLAFAPDGKSLVLCGNSPLLRIWDVAAKALKPPPDGHTREVTGVAFTPDGLTLISSSADRTWRQWDPFKRQELRSERSPAAPMTALAVAENGRVFATGSVDGTVKVWDAATGKETGSLPLFKTGVRCVDISADGRVLAAAGDERSIKLWDLAANKERPALPAPAHAERIFGIALNGDGTRLASASLDQTVKFWDLSTLAPVSSLTGQKGDFLCLALASNGLSLAAAGNNKSIVFFDTSAGTVSARLQEKNLHTEAVVALAYSPDGQYLVSAGIDGQVILWKAGTTQRQKVWQFPDLIVRVAFAPDSRHIAIGAANGLLYIIRIGPPPGPGKT